MTNMSREEAAARVARRDRAYEILDKLRAAGVENENRLCAALGSDGFLRSDAIRYFHAWHHQRAQEMIAAAPKSVKEWTPDRWWVVAQTGQDGSFTPLHEGIGNTSSDRKADCDRWLASYP